jgi:transcriptional antiterminator
LILANTWNNTWPYIQHTIEENLRKTIRIKYKNLNIKLTKLEQQQQQQQKYKVLSDRVMYILSGILAYIQPNRDVSLPAVY